MRAADNQCADGATYSQRVGSLRTPNHLLLGLEAAKTSRMQCHSMNLPQPFEQGPFRGLPDARASLLSRSALPQIRHVRRSIVGLITVTVWNIGVINLLPKSP